MEKLNLKEKMIKMLETESGVKRLIELQNKYLDGHGVAHCIVYGNHNDFFRRYFQNKYSEMATAISNGKYNSNHQYVYLTTYKAVHSFRWFEAEKHLLLDEIVEWLSENDSARDEFLASVM